MALNDPPPELALAYRRIISAPEGDCHLFQVTDSNNSLITSNGVNRRMADLQQRERALLDLEQSLRVRESSLSVLEGHARQSQQYPAAAVSATENEGVRAISGKNPCSMLTLRTLISLQNLHLYEPRMRTSSLNSRHPT